MSSANKGNEEEVFWRRTNSRIFSREKSIPGSNYIGTTLHCCRASFPGMHGWFGGEFDASQFDETALRELRNEHGPNPVVCEPLKKLEIILTK